MVSSTPATSWFIHSQINTDKANSRTKTLRTMPLVHTTPQAHQSFFSISSALLVLTKLVIHYHSVVGPKLTYGHP